jgi:hypothetical protein
VVEPISHLEEPMEAVGLRLTPEARIDRSRRWTSCAGLSRFRMLRAFQIRCGTQRLSAHAAAGAGKAPARGWGGAGRDRSRPRLCRPEPSDAMVSSRLRNCARAIQAWEFWRASRLIGAGSPGHPNFAIPTQACMRRRIGVAALPLVYVR